VPRAKLEAVGWVMVRLLRRGHSLEKTGSHNRNISSREDATSGAAATRPRCTSPFPMEPAAPRPFPTVGQRLPGRRGRAWAATGRPPVHHARHQLFFIGSCILLSVVNRDPILSVHSLLLAELDVMKEKFSKLLLGEDMSGTGKGVPSALALSNAITNLAASVFGEQRKLEPMAPDTKERWKREVGWLLSVTDLIVEFVPTRQTAENGTTMEVITLLCLAVSRDVLVWL
jgi:hypothetical protein